MSNKEYVLLDMVSTFRMRYLVEVPEGRVDLAVQSVKDCEAKEFSQLHLNENYFSDRVVTREEAIRIFRTDNDYLKGWSDEMVMKSALTQLKDGVL